MTPATFMYIVKSKKLEFFRTGEGKMNFRTGKPATWKYSIKGHDSFSAYLTDRQAESLKYSIEKGV